MSLLVRFCCDFAVYDCYTCLLPLQKTLSAGTNAGTNAVYLTDGWSFLFIDVVVTNKTTVR